MSNKNWYYELKAERKGPVSVEQIDALIEADVLAAHSKVWSEEFEDWTPIFKTELRSYLKEENVGPPPLSKPAPAESVAAPSAAATAAQPPSEFVSYEQKDLSVLQVMIGITFMPLALWWSWTGWVLIREKSISRQAGLYIEMNYGDFFPIIEGLVILIAVIMFLMWTYRVVYNAQVIAKRKMEISPGWAVGWYFIPIANFWMPLQAMRQAWRASGGSHTSLVWLGFWWWIYILTSLANVIAMVVVETEGSGRSEMVFYAYTSIGMAISALISVNIVKEFTTLQKLAR